MNARGIKIGNDCFKGKGYVPVRRLNEDSVRAHLTLVTLILEAHFCIMPTKSRPA